MNQTCTDIRLISFNSVYTSLYINVLNESCDFPASHLWLAEDSAPGVLHLCRSKRRPSPRDHRSQPQGSGKVSAAAWWSGLTMPITGVSCRFVALWPPLYPLPLRPGQVDIDQKFVNPGYRRPSNFQFKSHVILRQFWRHSFEKKGHE